MRPMSHSRWLLIASCLVVSACTEKTVVYEVPIIDDGDTSVATSTSSSSSTSTATSALTTTATLPGTLTESPTTPSPTTLTAAETEAETDISLTTASTATAIPDTSIADLPEPVLNNPIPNMVDGVPVAGGATTPGTQTINETQEVDDTRTALTLDPLGNDLQDATTTENSSPPSTTDNNDEEPPELAETSVNGDLLSDPVNRPDLTQETSAVQPAAPSITGTPGMSVACKQTLPCRWVSDDTQFFVTVTNADNIGAQGRLSIEYSVQTVHDTQVLITNTEPAVDSAGVVYAPSALRLGDVVGGSAQALVAGAPITATIEFDNPSTATSIDSWSIGLSDSGLARQPVFSGIPIGSATSQHAECSNVLPCAWESPTKDITITLLSVNGSGAANALSTNFKIEATRSVAVAVDEGATAMGTDGMSYRGRTHTMGLETGAEKLTGNTIPGAQVAGTVFFYRTQSMSPALQHLDLVIYEDQPVPRWNPSFLNVPVQ